MNVRIRYRHSEVATGTERVFTEISSIDWGAQYVALLIDEEGGEQPRYIVAGSLVAEIEILDGRVAQGGVH